MRRRGVLAPRDRVPEGSCTIASRQAGPKAVPKSAAPTRRARGSRTVAVPRVDGRKMRHTDQRTPNRGSLGSAQWSSPHSPQCIQRCLARSATHAGSTTFPRLRITRATLDCDWPAVICANVRPRSRVSPTTDQFSHRKHPRLTRSTETPNGARSHAMRRSTLQLVRTSREASRPRRAPASESPVSPPRDASYRAYQATDPATNQTPSAPPPAPDPHPSTSTRPEDPSALH